MSSPFDHTQFRTDFRHPTWMSNRPSFGIQSRGCFGQTRVPPSRTDTRKSDPSGFPARSRRRDDGRGCSRHRPPAVRWVSADSRPTGPETRRTAKGMVLNSAVIDKLGVVIVGVVIVAFPIYVAKQGPLCRHVVPACPRARAVAGGACRIDSPAGMGRSVGRTSRKPFLPVIVTKPSGTR